MHTHTRRYSTPHPRSSHPYPPFHSSSLHHSYRAQHGDIIIWRNLLFAPITEEIVFRALMIPPLSSVYYFNYDRTPLIQKFGSLKPEGFALTPPRTLPFLTLSPWKIILTCPMFFALAHLHHCYEKIRHGERISRALTSTLIQATYTSIFGVIAALLFMRTNTILAPIVSHVICNFVGLPDVGFLAPPPVGSRRVSNVFAFDKVTTHVPGGSMDGDADNSMNNISGRSEYSSLYAYRYLLLVLHVAGLVLFALAIDPLTAWDVEDSMYWGWGKMVL